MDITMIQKLINKKYPDAYSKKGMQALLESIEDLPEDLRKATEDFLAKGTIPDIETEGYSVHKLQKEHGMNEIAAILTLGWLRKEPTKARSAIEKGHDFVKTK